MVRKIATQVPQAVTRLLQAQTITPPVWYQAYLDHPPQPLPPRRLAPVDLSLFSRSVASPDGQPNHGITHRAKRAKTPKLKVPELRFQEDEIRRRFFTDFPFEALRPVSLIEGRTVGEGRQGLIDGKEWTALSQRGEVPTVEDTIAFTLNLHTAHSTTLSQAYQIATSQFIKLRAIDEIANYAAEEEVLAYTHVDVDSGSGGMGLGVGKEGNSRKAFDRFFDLETRALRTNYPSTSSTSTSYTTSSSSPSSAPLPARFLFGPNLPKRRAWSPHMDELSTSLGKARAEDLDAHGGAMPYSDGLNYVMKWKALRGRSRRAGKVNVEAGEAGAEGVKESVGVDADKVEQAGVNEVKQEEDVHVRV